jgi:hypothetical protein
MGTLTLLHVICLQILSWAGRCHDQARKRLRSPRLATSAFTGVVACGGDRAPRDRCDVALRGILKQGPWIAVSEIYFDRCQVACDGKRKEPEGFIFELSRW